jgi:hypothetical protein
VLVCTAIAFYPYIAAAVYLAYVFSSETGNTEEGTENVFNKSP